MKQHPKYPNIRVSESGEVFSIHSDRMLTPTLSRYGYHTVYVKDYGKSKRVHRLVCETYLQNSGAYGLDVNHIDGNKTNNHLDNLEWCTRAQNIQHAYDTGLNSNKGERSPNCTHSEVTIHEICQCLQDGWRNKDVATHFDVSRSFIANIRRGGSWLEVSSQYSFTVKRNSRLSVDSVHKVCRLLSEGFTPAQAHKKFNSGSPTYKDILNIRTGKTWKTISCQYVIPKSSRLSESEVRSVCVALSGGSSVRSVAKNQKVSFDQVQKIYKRTSRLDVSRDYEF